MNTNECGLGTGVKMEDRDVMKRVVSSCES